MKYMVMECSTGRAVLMDEEGRFVFAANLGYEVGQSVTDPILLGEKEKKHNGIIVMRTIAAAAASVAILFAPCYSYYARNLKPCSAVTITSHAAISMELNRDGKVIRLQSDSDYGKELIEKHDIKGKDKLEAVNEILQSEISDGYLSDGDTVDVYIESKDDTAYDSYKTEFEEELPKLAIKVNVHEKDEKKPEPPLKEEKPEKEQPEKPEKEQPEKPDTPKNPVPPVENPTAPAGPVPEDAPTPPGHGNLKPTPEPPVRPDTPEDPMQGQDNPEIPIKPEKPGRPEHTPPHRYSEGEPPYPTDSEIPVDETENMPHFHQKPNMHMHPVPDEETPAELPLPAPELNTEPLHEEIPTD